MTQSIEQLEREIEESRARLDQTIDRIQGRLSVTGIMDEAVGTLRVTEFGSVIDHVLGIVRRNPVPVLLVAAGVSWLLYRMNQESRSRTLARAEALEEESIPIINTGQARIYDPDVSPLHPTQDALETRREISARA